MNTTIAKKDPFSFEGVTLTKAGARISPDCPFEGWEEALQFAQRTQAGSQLWIGDLVNFGEQRYGDKYEQALSIFTVPYDTLAQWASVAKKTADARKVDQKYTESCTPCATFSANTPYIGLNYSHFREVAPLPAEEQVKLLEEAAADGPGGHAWQVKAVKEAVKQIWKRLRGEVEEEEEEEEPADEVEEEEDEPVEEEDEPKEDENPRETFDKSVRKWAKEMSAFVDQLPKNPWICVSTKDHVRRQLKAAASSVRSQISAGWCPLCDSEGCDRCRGTGWVPKRVLEALEG